MAAAEQRKEGRRLLKPALLCCAANYVSGVDTANKWKENRSERLMSVGPPSLLLPPLASSKERKKERNLLISRIPPHLTFPSSGPEACFRKELRNSFGAFHFTKKGIERIEWEGGRKGERESGDLKLDL